MICVDKLLFDEKGNERDIDVDFKKLKLHMSQHSSEAYDFDIVRKQKLPLLQIQPLTQDDLRAMIGQAREKLTTMKGSAESVMLANINLVKMTWQYLHDMLGHQCDDYMRKVVTHQMLDGLPDLGKFPFEGVKKFCDSCHIGEQHRRHVPEQSTRDHEDPEGIDLFIDIGGPWPVRSSRGNIMWLLLRERNNAHLAIYFTKNKENMEKVFDQYIIDVDDKRKQIGAVHVDVRLVAHDDDICFLSKAFKNLVREKKIKQVVIPPYTHAMMGAVEGYMKHVKQGTIKLRHQSGLPNFLWDEMMGAYVYQRNRSYTSACNTSMHKYQCPHVRKFPDDKPDARTLVRIGAKTFVYIDADERRVGENHAYVGYVCGYSKCLRVFKMCEWIPCV